jgi:hypothetical protein
MNDEALPLVWISFDLVALEREGKTFNPDYVTEMLGVLPTEHNRIGDSILHGKGRRTYDRWRVSVGPVETIEIEPMLDEVVGRFSDCGDRLPQVCDEIGVEPVLMCRVEPKSAETPAITKGPTTTYGYDQAGNLLSVERPEKESVPKIEDTYAYNGEGLRTSQTISGTTSYLAWDMGGRTPADLE